ncbi:MAG: Gfo/Idh/MocA family oxidoreductase [Chloroflexi bacterium]|nr:Gfo/Idh/MocA family oxidoreductase [Chloroflexota bacterium]
MENTIRWGIIGCGNVAELKSGPPLYRTPGSELVAVMRRDAAKAEDFARRHNVKRWYTDARALVADPDVNAVYVASPHYLHLEHVTLAAEAHKIVLCEKPMGTGVAEAQAIVEVCQRNGVPLNVAYYRRFWYVTRAIKRLLNEGAIGRVLQARVQLSALIADYFADDARYAWLNSRTQSGGGVLANAGSHWVDLIRFFLGEVTDVMAYCSSQASGFEIEDTLSAQMRTRDGALVSLLLTFESPASINEFDILGTEGRILGGPLAEGFWKLERRGKNPELVNFPYSGTAHSDFITELIPNLLCQQPALIPGEEAVAAWKIMEAIYRSCENGARISVE